jgi:hypothetical protein
MIAEKESTKNADTVAVLLVGDGVRNASMLHDYLRRRGCDIFHAASCKKAQENLRERHYDLVLSDFMLCDGTAYQLMSCLRGTRTTMFFSNVVEDGCWWMNAVYKGQDHSEDPGMRPAQFRILLNDILFDQLFRNAHELRCKPHAARCDDLGLQVRKEMKEDCYAKG